MGLVNIVCPIAKSGVCKMDGYNCGYGGRGFLTKEEKIEMLEDYNASLEKEAQGVAERIKDLKKAS